MKSIKKIETLDKCNLCNWEGPSDEVIEKETEMFGTTWHCPVCDSQDLDDIDFDSYDNDEDDPDDGPILNGGPSNDTLHFYN